MPSRRPGTAAPEVAIGVAAVARRFGVATGTLRTWDRRYGLGPSEHATGTRRRYGRTDLARLEVMRALMLQGVATADAAAAALAATLTELPEGSEPLPRLPPGHHPSVAARTLARHMRGPGRPGRVGGGRVLPVGAAGPAARGLSRAAMALDGDAAAELLAGSVARCGVVNTWTEMLLPVLTGLGRRWSSTGAGAEVEHLLSEVAESVLRSVALESSRARRGTGPVLLAALEPEDHRLALVVLAAALAERRVAVRLLGVRLPPRALADALTRTGALAVYLWAHGAAGPGTSRVPSEVAAAAKALRPRSALLLGGLGWDVESQATTAAWLPDLPTAVETVVGLVGGGARSSAAR